MEIRVRERTIDLTIGYSSVVLFGISLLVLIWFLRVGVSRPEDDLDAIRRRLEEATGGRGDPRAAFDTLLVAAWGFVHSLLARPRLKVQMQKILRPHLQAAVYSIVASASLILVCLLYRPIPRVVYALQGGPAFFVLLLFYAGWGLFAWCFFHLDLLEITGLRPILHYLGRNPRVPQPFRPTGPFLWVRHPVELAFLVAFWAAPVMTAGHLLFTIVMTLYTFLGIDLEDRKMLDLYGGAYLDYVKRVPQILPLPR